MNLLHRITALNRFLTRPLGAAFAGALAVCTPLALVLPTAPAMAQQGDRATLDRAIRAMRAITTMQADFTQTDRNGQVVSGKLTWKNPGRIRFEYGEDADLLVVSNGSALTFVDYDVRQVERYPIGDTPLGALLDPEANLAQYGQVRPSNAANVVSIAVSDPDKPEFPEITLIFLENRSAPGGLELVSWVALDSQNIRTTVRLRNHRYGMNIPNSAFTFRDPRPSAASRRPG